MEENFYKCYKEFIFESYWIWAHYFRNLHITGLFVLAKTFEFLKTDEPFLVSFVLKIKNKEVKFKISKHFWGFKVAVAVSLPNNKTDTC